MHLKPTFTLNEYDSDGDISKKGVFLHFGKNIKIRVSDSIVQFSWFIHELEKIEKELEE